MIPPNASASTTMTSSNNPTASAINVYDVCQAFDVFDIGRDGCITLHDLQTLYLGLGFLPERMTLAMLRNELNDLVTSVAVAAATNDETATQHNASKSNSTMTSTKLDYNQIPLELVLRLLSNRPRLDRTETFQNAFHDIDIDEKGYIDSNDIRRLAVEQQSLRQDPLSSVQASRMVSYTVAATSTRTSSPSISTLRTTNLIDGGNMNDVGVDFQRFYSLFAPPDP